MKDTTKIFALPSRAQSDHANYKGPWKRFRTKFTASTSNECWLWQGAKDKNGYGVMHRGLDFDCRASNVLAHRVAWMYFHGDIPEGKHILHTCDTPACVNPDHLFLGDQNDNNQDKVAKGRQPNGVRHYRATFTEDDIRTIRASTKSRAELAREYNTQWPTIDKIVRRLRWKHVT